MVSVRFVGGDSCEIGLTEYDTVGMRASMSEQGFREAVIGGAAFIGEADFARCGFNDDELKRWAKSGERVEPSASFVAKHTLAQKFFLDLRARMLHGDLGTFCEAQELAEA
jgi:hypothetical protein